MDTITLTNYKAVIFDMDGTMIDNMMVHHYAWQEKLSELGLDLTIEEVMQEIHGINEEIFVRLFGDKFTPEEIRMHAADKEARYRRIFKDSLSLVPGLDGLLNDLKNSHLKLSIGSAAPPENIDFVIDNLNIRSLFEVIKHSKDVKKGKPDPEIYLKIMQDLQTDPKDCIIFEDSPTGAESAVRSGAHTAVITTTHEPKEFSHLKSIMAFTKDFEGVKL